MVTLDFTAWSELSVRLFERPPSVRRQLLEDADLSEDEWQTIDAWHTDALARALAQGDPRRAVIRVRHFEEERQRRRQEHLEDAPAASNATPGATLDAEEVSHLRIRPVMPFLRPVPDHDLPRPAPPVPWPAACEPGATVDLSALAPVRPSPPFAVPHPAPTMPIARYAALTADLRAHPSQQQTVLERHGVANLDSLAHLDRAYAEQFAQDAALKRHFDELVAQFRAWQ